MDVRTDQASKAKRAVFVLGFLGLALACDLLFDRWISDSSLRQLFLLAAVNMMIALSLNLINGLAGQFSIGHAGFVGVGAYTAAVVAAHLQKAWPGDVSFVRSLVFVPAAVVPAALLAGFFGLLVGLPSLRLRGDYLAVVTFGFAEIFRLLLATATADGSGVSGWLGRLGGQNGYAGPEDDGIPQYAGPFWLLTAVALLVVTSWRIKFSGWGRALRALREDEIAAAAAGVDPTGYKVTSFVLAAAGGGIAGALGAIMRDGSPVTQPDQFGFQTSFDAITMVILGGAGSITGCLFGALFVTGTVQAIEVLQATESVQAFRTSHEWLDLNALRMVLYGLGLLAIMLWRPDGLFGERELLQPSRRAEVPA